MKNLIAALIKFQAQLPPAPKVAQNPHFKTHYADLVSVWETIRKPLTDNNLCITQVIRAGELVTTLWHNSGEYVESVMPIYGGQTVQGFGSGLTYARRYSIVALCGVISDDDDGNAAMPSMLPVEPQKPAPRPNTRTPLLPSNLRIYIEKKAANDHGGIKPETAKIVAVRLNTLTLGDEDARRDIMQYLFGTRTTNDLTEGQGRAILDWTKQTKGADGEWQFDPATLAEATAVVAEMERGE